MGLWSAIGGLRRSRSGNFSKEGSSRRGRRWGSGRSSQAQDEPSTGKADSSTHSALFDLELSHRGGAGGRAADYLARLNHSVADDGSTHASGDPSVRLPTGLLQRIIYLGRPVMEFELDLLQDVRALRPSCQLTPDGQLDLDCLTQQLQELGYACYHKKNNPADPGHRHNVQPSCLEKLRHEYIVCAGRADGSLSHWCLVDLRFRDQFAIAQPTPQYERVLKAVPLEFVGTPLRLQALVETLCGEMADAFTVQQLTLPPWRRVNALLSKWLDPEEMPPPPPPPQQLPAQQQLQLQAAAGPPLSPFELAAQAAAAQAAAQAGVGGVPLTDLARGPASSAAARSQSLLQQQAAAALAERQSSNGGSQEFYEALAMHKESMRLQQQAVAAAAFLGQQRRCSPPGAQQQQAPPAQQQQQQQQAPLDGLRQLDAPTPGSSSEPLRQASERSNKPRRRRGSFAPDAHGTLASLWGPPDSEPEPLGYPADMGAAGRRGGGGAAGQLGLRGASAAAASNLHASGSWSDLSTILETRSNASSPATAAVLTATNAQLGTSCASRRSACSAATAPVQPLRSPLRLDLLPAAGGMRRSASASGSFDAPHGLPPALPLPLLHPSPGSTIAGFTLAQLSVAPSAASGPAGAAPSSSRGQGSPASSASGLRPEDWESCSAGGGASGVPAGQRKKAVSLLAKNLKSSVKQTWANLLPGVNSVRRVGAAGATAPAPQRSWSRRSADGSDSSSHRGWRQQAAAAAAAPAQPADPGRPPLQRL